jgi:hypothetical protein
MTHISSSVVDLMATIAPPPDLSISPEFGRIQMPQPLIPL